jgi:hypothetical protein
LTPNDVPLGTTSEQLITLLPRLLNLRPTDTLHFVRYLRFKSSKTRARSRHTDRERVAEWLRHERLHARDFTTIRAAALTRARIATSAAAAERAGRMLALSSRCAVARGLTMNIPLMDLRVPARTRAQHQLESALAQMSLPSIVLKSGRSFHVYGCRLMSQAEWLDFMGTCLLLGDLVDWRFVGHCVRRRMSSLRIYGKKERYRNQPKVVARVNV